MRALGDVRFRPLRDDQEQESFEQQLLPLKTLVLQWSGFAVPQSAMLGIQRASINWGVNDCTELCVS